jgi:hypothetical protein
MTAQKHTEAQYKVEQTYVQIDDLEESNSCTRTKNALLWIVDSEIRVFDFLRYNRFHWSEIIKILQYSMIERLNVIALLVAWIEI